MRALRWLTNAGIFFCALALGCAAIGSRLDVPEVTEVSAKLRRLRSSAGEFDTIYFGSSRIYHQIIPSIFDELTAAGGRPTHSFNAAVDAMKPLELNFFVEHALRQAPPGVRLVLIEQGSVSPSIRENEAGTIRFDYWHDASRMLGLWRRVWIDWKPPRHLGRKWVASTATPLGEFWPHVAPFMRSFTNLGRSAEFREWLSGPNRIPDDEFLGERRDGYRLSSAPDPMTPESRALYEQELQRRGTQPSLPAESDAASQQSFEELVRWIERRGARVVLVNAPTLGTRCFQLGTRDTSGRLVLNYANPAAYPELFVPEHRQDEGHLNRAGAEIFTRLVAQEFVAGEQRK